MTSDLWALIATLGLAMVQIGLQSILILLFFISRCLYLPAYAYGPPGLRSIFWQGGQVGIIVILFDIIM